jgi:hypothetical protein
MAKKKSSKLTLRVHELEDAVTRLFTGEGPAPAMPKKRKRKSSARNATLTAVKKTTKKMLKKSAKKAKGKIKKKSVFV